MFWPSYKYDSTVSGFWTYSREWPGLQCHSVLEMRLRLELHPNLVAGLAIFTLTKRAISGKDKVPDHVTNGVILSASFGGMKPHTCSCSQMGSSVHEAIWRYHVHPYKQTVTGEV